MIQRITSLLLVVAYSYCLVASVVDAARLPASQAGMITTYNKHGNNYLTEKDIDAKLAAYFAEKHAYPVKVPEEGSNGVYLNESMTGGAFYEGWYQNTTRLTKRHHYFFQWRLACSWMKWTPTNQIIAAKKYLDETNSTMRMGRYGITGWDKQCYWGLIGVQWIRPLPLWQFKTNIWILQPEQDMAIGFSGKTVKDENGKEQKVLQIEDWGEYDTWFSLFRIMEGPYKDHFILKCRNDNSLVLDILNDRALDHQHLIRNPLDYSVSQLWQITQITTSPVLYKVKDHTGYWCLTRFTKHQAEQSSSVPEYETDIQLSPCESEDIRNQQWYLAKPTNTEQ